MLKPFEYGYLLCSPFLPPLYRRVRRELYRALGSCIGRPTVLDVGGRKSHYTIGIPAAVTITDLPRISEVQRMLNLGTNSLINEQILARRSNVSGTVYDDMTRTGLHENSFDVVVAVEVLEHVEQDEAFVTNVWRVLKPGGTFVMTTPNGDFVTNHNPDHKRHYRRDQLRAVLGRTFPEVEVYYGIRGGRFRKWGLQSWNPGKPVQTARSMLGNLLNTFQSAHGQVPDMAKGTHHLFARCRKETRKSWDPVKQGHAVKAMMKLEESR